MQIQSQNNFNFKGRVPITSSKQKANMIEHLGEMGKSYKIHDNNIYWGKDLTKLVKNVAEAMSLERFEAGVIKHKKEFFQNKAKKVARLDELVNGKKIGTQGLRLRLRGGKLHELF